MKEILFIEFIDYMNAYRLFRPTQPWKTIVWVDSVDEARGICTELCAELCLNGAVLLMDKDLMKKAGER